MFVLRINLKDFKRLKSTKKDFNAWSKKGFTKTMDTLLAWSKINGGHPTFTNRTGKTAQSLQRTILNSGVKGRIYSDSIVTTWLYYGTKRHWVEPVRKLALSWVQDGTRRFSMGHFVSGIKGDTWVENLYDKKEKKLNGYIEESIIAGARKKWL